MEYPRVYIIIQPNKHMFSFILAINLRTTLNTFFTSLFVSIRQVLQLRTSPSYNSHYTIILDKFTTSNVTYQVREGKASSRNVILFSVRLKQDFSKWREQIWIVFVNIFKFSSPIVSSQIFVFPILTGSP